MGGSWHARKHMVLFSDGFCRRKNPLNVPFSTSLACPMQAKIDPNFAVKEHGQSDSPAVDGIVPQVGAEEIDYTLKEQGLERFHQDLKRGKATPAHPINS